MILRPADPGSVDVPWPRVLVADDDAGACHGLYRSLVRLGFDVVGTASDAAEALDAARCLHPDVVLLDIDMSGGIEAVRDLRHRLPSTRVLVITAGRDSVMDREAREAGASASLVRGCSLRMVDDAIVDAWGAARGAPLRSGSGE